MWIAKCVLRDETCSFTIDKKEILHEIALSKAGKAVMQQRFYKTSVRLFSRLLTFHLVNVQ